MLYTIVLTIHELVNWDKCHLFSTPSLFLPPNPSPPFQVLLDTHSDKTVDQWMRAVGMTRCIGLDVGAGGIRREIVGWLVVGIFVGGAEGLAPSLEHSGNSKEMKLSQETIEKQLLRH